MTEIIIPRKIAWWNDVSPGFEKRWSSRQVKQVMKSWELYSNLVTIQMLPRECIDTHFFPLYDSTVRQKQDYHLSRQDLEEGRAKIAADPTYSLVWFTSPDGSHAYGGYVVYISPTAVKTAYRAFDHHLTRSLDMPYFDYYADFRLQSMMRDRGVTHLSRGLMAHPITNLGLISFRLRTGAYPKKTFREVGTHALSEHELSAFARETGVCAYFENADTHDRWQKMTLYCADPEIVHTHNVLPNLEKIGITVEIINL